MKSLFSTIFCILDKKYFAKILFLNHATNFLPNSVAIEEASQVSIRLISSTRRTVMYYPPVHH